MFHKDFHRPSVFEKREIQWKCTKKDNFYRVRSRYKVPPTDTSIDHMTPGSSEKRSDCHNILPLQRFGIVVIHPGNVLDLHTVNSYVNYLNWLVFAQASRYAKPTCATSWSTVIIHWIQLGALYGNRYTQSLNWYSFGRRRYNVW